MSPNRHPADAHFQAAQTRFPLPRFFSSELFPLRTVLATNFPPPVGCLPSPRPMLFSTSAAPSNISETPQAHHSLFNASYDLRSTQATQVA